MTFSRKRLEGTWAIPRVSAKNDRHSNVAKIWGWEKVNETGVKEDLKWWQHNKWFSYLFRERRLDGGKALGYRCAVRAFAALCQWPFEECFTFSRNLIRHAFSDYILLYRELILVFFLSEHSACQDSGLSQIFKLIVSTREKILDNIDRVEWRQVK